MSRERQRGTTWESAIVGYLVSCGWVHAERRALSGARDRGDISGLPGLVIEAKNAARIELAQWVKETLQEVDNAGADLGCLWIKRRGKSSPADAYVVLDGASFARLLRQAGW